MFRVSLFPSTPERYMTTNRNPFLVHSHVFIRNFASGLHVPPPRHSFLFSPVSSCRPLCLDFHAHCHSVAWSLGGCATTRARGHCRWVRHSVTERDETEPATAGGGAPRVIGTVSVSGSVSVSVSVSVDGDQTQAVGSAHASTINVPYFHISSQYSPSNVFLSIFHFSFIKYVFWGILSHFPCVFVTDC